MEYLLCARLSEPYPPTKKKLKNIPPQGAYAILVIRCEAENFYKERMGKCLVSSHSASTQGIVYVFNKS